MYVEAHVVVGEAGGPAEVNLLDRGELSQRQVLVGRVVEEVHRGQAAGQHVQHAHRDQLLLLGHTQQSDRRRQRVGLG